MLISMLIAAAAAGGLPLLEVTDSEGLTVLREPAPLPSTGPWSAELEHLHLEVQGSHTDSGVSGILEGDLVFTAGGRAEARCDFYGIIAYDQDKSVPCVLEKTPGYFIGDQRVGELKYRVGVRWVDEADWEDGALALPPLERGGRGLYQSGLPLLELGRRLALGGAATAGVSYLGWYYLARTDAPLALTGLGLLAVEAAPALYYAGARRSLNGLDPSDGLYLMFQPRVRRAGLLLGAGYAALLLSPASAGAAGLASAALLTGSAWVASDVGRSIHEDRAGGGASLELRLLPQPDGLALGGRF